MSHTVTAPSARPPRSPFFANSLRGIPLPMVFLLLGHYALKQVFHLAGEGL